MGTTEVAVYEGRDIAIVRPPEEVLHEAQRAAKALADVVSKKKKPVMMNGEQYLEFEDWQTVGKFYHTTAKIVSTTPVELGDVRGYEARAVAMDTITGMEVSAAEAMCLNDEPNWKNKPLFQLRSMAQTRAAAKALRNVLAWVVVLAGYRATPAEEIQDMVKEKKADIQQPKSKSESGKSSKESLIAELSTYVHGDPNKFKTVLKEVTAFGDNKGTTDIEKVSEKWAGSALGKLRDRIKAEKEAAKPEGCTEDPNTCGESKFDDKEKAYCGDSTDKPCPYQKQGNLV